MTIRTTLFSALMFSAFLIPGVTRAFDLVDTTAHQVTEDTYLFTVTYEVGYLNATAYLPIEAEIGEGSNEPLPNISYELQDRNGDTLTDGQLVGVVLSDVSVFENKYYQVAEGERETFTLLVLYRGSARPETLYVTSLGNVVDTGEKTSFIEATSEELLEYQATVEMTPGK